MLIKLRLKVRKRLNCETGMNLIAKKERNGGCENKKNNEKEETKQLNLLGRHQYNTIQMLRGGFQSVTVPPRLSE